MSDQRTRIQAASWPLRVVIVSASLLWCMGCGLTGDWRTVTVMSGRDNDMPMLSAISFAPDGRYTATEHRNAEQTTSTGRFEWNGMQLKLVPENGDAREYPCVRNSDGSMALKYSASVTATLRVSD